MQPPIGALHLQVQAASTLPQSGSRRTPSGFDQTYDQVVPPPPPTDVYLYIFDNAKSSSPVNLQDLQVDLLPDSASSWTWTLDVENINPTASVTLSWSGTPPTATLTPSGGSSVQMSEQSSYTWTATQGTVYSFTVTAGSSGSGGSGGSGGSKGNTSPTPTAVPTLNQDSVSHSAAPWGWDGLGSSNWHFKLPSFSLGGSGSVNTDAGVALFVLAIVAVFLVVAVLLRRRK